MKNDNEKQIIRKQNEKQQQITNNKRIKLEITIKNREYENKIQKQQQITENIRIKLEIATNNKE